MKIKGKQLEDTLRTESAPFTKIFCDDLVGNLNGAIRFEAKNTSGGTIQKGQAVYVTGVSGDTKPTIALAQANSANTMPAFGLAMETISNNGSGEIVTFGNLTNVPTNDFGLTDTLYISATNEGEIVNTPPAGSGNLIQNIGKVIRVHQTNGTIKVGGAGRTNATPNLDEGKFFLGNASNQSVQSGYKLPTSVGTEGQVLTSNGTDVTFQDASGGGGTSYTEVTASISEADFTIQDMFIPTDASSGIVINLPTVKNQFTKATSYDGDRFIIDNKSTYTVQLRIAELSNYNTSASPKRYEQTYMRHSGNYDATGVYSSNNSSGEYIYEIAPMSRVEIEVHQYINTAPSTDIYRIIYNVTSTGGMIGAFYYNYITASQTALTNNIYVCDGTFTLTLPSRDSDFGERIEVKNYGTGTITLDPDLGNINGSATYSLTAGSYVTLMRIHLGTNYWITL